MCFNLYHSLPPGKNSRLNMGLQKKITRLIVADFCCWVPVCTGGGFVRFCLVIYIPNNAALRTGEKTLRYWKTLEDASIMGLENRLRYGGGGGGAVAYSSVS